MRVEGDTRGGSREREAGGCSWDGGAKRVHGLPWELLTSWKTPLLTAGVRGRCADRHVIAFQGASPPDLGDCPRARGDGSSHPYHLPHPPVSRPPAEG